jgi:hypothetical protein
LNFMYCIFFSMLLHIDLIRKWSSLHPMFALASFGDAMFPASTHEFRAPGKVLLGFRGPYRWRCIGLHSGKLNVNTSDQHQAYTQYVCLCFDATLLHIVTLVNSSLLPPAHVSFDHAKRRRLLTSKQGKSSCSLSRSRSHAKMHVTQAAGLDLYTDLEHHTAKTPCDV